MPQPRPPRPLRGRRSRGAPVALLLLLALTARGTPAAAQAPIDTEPPPDLQEEGVGQNLVPMLGAWTGVWETEDVRTNPAGRRFRYRFVMEWYDRGQTLIAYRIEQHFEDAASGVLWEGTKGYDAVRRVTFSDQRSRAGIYGRGVYGPGPDGTWVVYGQGTGPAGALPPVRDVFQPLAGERRFRTVTWMLLDGTWTVQGVDVWRPVTEGQEPSTPAAHDAFSAGPAPAPAPGPAGGTSNRW